MNRVRLAISRTTELQHLPDCLTPAMPQYASSSLSVTWIPILAGNILRFPTLKGRVFGLEKSKKMKSRRVCVCNLLGLKSRKKMGKVQKSKIGRKKIVGIEKSKTFWFFAKKKDQRGKVFVFRFCLIYSGRSPCPSAQTFKVLSGLLLKFQCALPKSPVLSLLVNPQSYLCQSFLVKPWLSWHKRQ